MARSIIKQIVLIAALSGSFGIGSALAQEKKVPQNRFEMQMSFAPLVKKVAPAVVNIYTRKKMRTTARSRSRLFDDPFFRRFFGDRLNNQNRKKRRRRSGNSLGSGVILDPDGLIITNHHVIAGAESITVATSDRQAFKAELILSDKESDLAVLKVNPGEYQLPYLKLQDSDQLEVGDIVLAIGNPFNVGQTVTSGIISALARTGIGVGDFQFFIQTDAAINPGNSGGALVTMDGRLAGINTAIYSKSGGSMGIGFAVPANMVRVVVANAKAGRSYVSRPWIGLTGQTVTRDLAKNLGLPRPMGIMVQNVHPQGPAAKVNLKRGDVILEVDGHKIKDVKSFKYRVGSRLFGGTADVFFLRDGQVLKAKIKLVPPPEIPPRNETRLAGDHPLRGVSVINISPAVAARLRMPEDARGVVVYNVEQGTPGHHRGMKPGDRILRVNDKTIANVKGLVRRMDQRRDSWHVAVQRGSRIFRLNFSR